MKTGQAGLALIETFEGLRLKPYLCAAGYPTIGYGSLRYPDGTRVTLDGRAVSEDEASAMLARDLEVAEAGVTRLIPRPLPGPKFDSLVSFTFNLGFGALRASTLRRRVLEGDDEGAAAEFGRWVYAGGRKVAGLVRRRAAEATLYLTA